MSGPSNGANGVHRDARRLRNGALWAAALLLLLLGIGFAVPDLRHVLDRASEAAPGWLVLAVGLELASCLGYVATLRLVLPRGPVREVRRLAWAEMAFGAVVPAGGAGSLAVGAWAMRAWGVAWSRIANRSAVVFLLTSAVNVVVLGLGGLGVLGGLGYAHTDVLYGLVPAVVAALLLGFFALLPRLVRPDRSGGRLTDVLERIATWVNDTKEISFTPDWRLLGAVGYLVFDIAVLWACLRAVGVSAPVFALVLGYQIGYLANLVPIPGGVGALEGGLLGALLLYGLPAAPTAAAVVLYHAIALWLPTMGGTVGFVRLRRGLASRGARVQAVSAQAATPVAGRPTSEISAGDPGRSVSDLAADRRPVRDLAA
ncbi:MAG TPA: lysylphosphatidylglycerol synthase domain-containing protein [Solirubrobacteraceae bacterium]